SDSIELSSQQVASRHGQFQLLTLRRVLSFGGRELRIFNTLDEEQRLGHPVLPRSHQCLRGRGPQGEPVKGHHRRGPASLRFESSETQTWAICGVREPCWALRGSQDFKNPGRYARTCGRSSGV